MCKIKPADITQASVSYTLQTEDEFVKNDWFMNQTFGFHGELQLDDLTFLASFFGEESKKFLPVAGVATKLNSNSTLIAKVYSFLPLPLQTGLPAHINGHFAIHSSRRSIWEHTSFGQWNRLLLNYIMAPSYSHLLRDLGQLIKTTAELKQWLKVLPDISSAKDEYFRNLCAKLYLYIQTTDCPMIPTSRESNTVTFHPPSVCLFVTANRNEVVEKLLVTLKQNLCTQPDIGLKFKRAGVDNLVTLTPQVLLERLKTIELRLPCPIKNTAFQCPADMRTILEFILSGDIVQDLNLLVGSPLCLSLDGVLRRFLVSQVSSQGT